jgi:hypothetical protein
VVNENTKGVVVGFSSPDTKMPSINHLLSKNFVLKALLLLLGGLYFFAGALPKHGDYWTWINISAAFALDPLHFMAGTGAVYPPTSYALGGVWLWLGSHLFHYHLTVIYNTIHTQTDFPINSYVWAGPGIFPFWGMMPILTALFLFVGIAYRELRNKWLALICFGPITFVSVFIMGQMDVVCVLFIFASMILLQRAWKAEKCLPLLLLSYLALGVSMQFKTYGGLLLPIYALYTLALARTRKLDIPKSLLTFLTLGSCLATLLVTTFIVWLPYPGWFNAIIVHGESSNLINFPSPLFLVPIWVLGYVSPLLNQVPIWEPGFWLLGYVLVVCYVAVHLPIWALGYVFIVCYVAARVFRNPLTSLRDDRYFVFDNFAIVAWFFIAVFTNPQWWMFLLPPALLVLDSFRKKNGLVVCILILITFLFYPMLQYWDVYPMQWNWGIGVYAFIALAALLLFWVLELKRELGDMELPSTSAR